VSVDRKEQGVEWPGGWEPTGDGVCGDHFFELPS